MKYEVWLVSRGCGIYTGDEVYSRCGTNRKRAAGSGRFRVGKQVWRWEV